MATIGRLSCDSSISQDLGSANTGWWSVSTVLSELAWGPRTTSEHRTTARTEAHRDRVRRAFREAGVEESRAAFVGLQPLADYLETYRLIDVALDPYPYGGGTTTCDALWMGVPVVSLAGRTAVSRAGSTLLSNVGLEHLVARNEEQYVELAAGLIRDAGGLAALRRELRRSIESSPVMDAKQFARDLEAAFRTAWRAWCEPRA